MCRSLSEGGRRCRGHSSAAASAGHNRRRRENRSLQREVIAWAESAGLPEAAVGCTVPLRTGSPPKRASIPSQGREVGLPASPSTGGPVATAPPVPTCSMASCGRSAMRSDAASRKYSPADPTLDPAWICAGHTETVTDRLVSSP